MKLTSLSLGKSVSSRSDVPWIIIAPLEELKSKKPWRTLGETASARLTRAIERLPEPLAQGGRLKIQGQSKLEADLLLVVLPKSKECFDLLEFARDSVRELLLQTTTQIGIAVLDQKNEAVLFDAFGAAVSARIFAMPVYGEKKKKEKKFLLNEIFLAGTKSGLKDFTYGQLTGEGTNLVRYLGTLPPNDLNTAGYGERIRAIAKENGFGLKFHSNQALKKMGAGAFTAVDQGDPHSAGGIWEIDYDPARGKKAKSKIKPVALVGKGLCFDTGGYDVKPDGYMVTMKGDMQGSAVALATLVTASKLKWPTPLKAFLAVTENHISPKAFKADEVVIALNGKSIEVVNTDAEGRMVLADALTLASRAQPSLIVDFATLTGSAVRAIGTGYSAVFSNREEFHLDLKRAGVKSGERVWPFPIVSSYAKALESPIADLKQCVKAGSPDHIMAAYFLSQFIEGEIPWVHVDLSCAENAGGLGHTDSLFTGFGVRFTIEFLKNAKMRKA